jgi:hypothetical protein
MPEYAQGMVLTCTHEGCGCRVQIQEECHCDGVSADSTYTCACGAPLVAVTG